jgi:hypothetical protein
MIVALIFLLISFWLLSKQELAKFLTDPMKKHSWALAKASLKLLGKLLRKVTSLFDPY